MPRRLVQGHELDILAHDASAKVGDLGERDDGMPKGGGGHVIDEIGDAVFETTDIEPIDQVQDERAIVLAHNRQTR